MSPSLLLPKFSPPTRLYSAKALTLLCLLSLLLIPHPAQAQGLPAGWTAVPCDATGNTNGTTGFQGTQTGTLTRTGTYKDINDFITANPDYYDDGTYENAAGFYIRPTYLNADAGATVKVSAIGVESNSDYGSQEGMQARNFDYNNSNSDGFFTAPGYNNEALSGTLATNVSAGLTVYFKCVWLGNGPQPKYPTSLSLKVTTTVTTTGSVNYGKAGETSGLMATANASDSLGDTLSASVMSPDDTSPPPLVTSYIVHASIDSGTGIASTGFSGQAQMTVSNMVPYTDYPYGRGTYTDYSTANAQAFITALAVSDSRAVTIVGGRVTSKKLLIGGVDMNGDGLWRQVTNQFDTNGTLSDDIAISLGEKHNEVISGGLHTVDSTIKTDSTYLPGLIGNWATEGAKYLENSSAKNYNLQGSLGDPFIDTPPTAADIPKITNTFVGPTVDNTNNGTIIWNDAGITDHVFFKFTNGDNRQMYPTAYPTGNDGDKAIASANYYLNLHRPFESFPSHRAPDTVYRIATVYPASGTDLLTGEADIPMTVDDPGYATYGDGTNGLAINVHLNNPSVGWALSSNIASLLSNIPYPGYLVALDAVFSDNSYP